jgi:hypothetical protein
MKIFERMSSPAVRNITGTYESPFGVVYQRDPSHALGLSSLGHEGHEEKRRSRRQHRVTEITGPTEKDKPIVLTALASSGPQIRTPLSREDVYKIFVVPSVRSVISVTRFCSS